MDLRGRHQCLLALRQATGRREALAFDLVVGRGASIGRGSLTEFVGSPTVYRTGGQEAACMVPTGRETQVISSSWRCLPKFIFSPAERLTVCDDAGMGTACSQ